MAGRPIKQGLDYFPFDIDFFDDEKIGAISGEFGIKGEITAIKLLCAVYRNGYFVVWNEPLKLKLLKSLPGISSELLEQILNRLVKWGFFDQSLFSLEMVLTSEGIQRRFFEITKRRKSNDNLPYLLIDVCNNGINACNNSINADNNTQSKGKESKSSSSMRVGEFPLFDNCLEKSLDECHETLRGDHSWIKSVHESLHFLHQGLTEQNVLSYLDDFFREQHGKGEKSKSIKDAMSHFFNWLRIQLNNRKNEKGSNNKKPYSISSTTFGRENPASEPYANAEGLEELINSIPVGR